VILIDEVDNFLNDRAKDLSTTKVHNQGVVNAFLRELDTFEGILVFTTNLSAELDPAVERRIQTRLCFPLPGEAERLKIWQNLWKETIPTDGTVDLAELARRFDFPGGLIRNTFLASCQRGAEAGRMSQEILLASCRDEQENRLKREASRRIKGFAS
jgi:SpoVK/Ycf46/Vps4 family AAA+-type ATPase